MASVLKSLKLGSITGPPGGKPSIYRGLINFIDEIRKCLNKECEESVVKKQICHIRDEFATEGLNAYQKKKHLLKLVYIFLLGYEVDIGLREAINLISSSKVTDKSIGYVFLSTVPFYESTQLPIAEACFLNDIKSNDPSVIFLSLQCLSCISETCFLKNCGSEIKRLTFSSTPVSAEIYQTAILCFLSLVRTFPEFSPDSKEAVDFCMKFIATRDLGILTSGLSVMEYLIQQKPSSFTGMVSPIIQRLDELSKDSSDVCAQYSFRKVKCPWIRIKLLKLLQILPSPTESTDTKLLSDILQLILSNVKPNTRIGQNSKHQIYILLALAFEALNLLCKLARNIASDALISQAAEALQHVIGIGDPNTKYLALEYICKVVGIPGFDQLTRVVAKQIMLSVEKERDCSVLQKLVDVLVIVSDEYNYHETVESMLFIVRNCEYEIKNAMICKTVALIDLYSLQDVCRYISNMVELIDAGGNANPPDVWYKVVHALANTNFPKELLVQKIFHLFRCETVPESVIQLGAYVIGEYGHLLSQDPGCSPTDQFNLMKMHFHFSERDSKLIILTALMKMRSRHVELNSLILQFLKNSQLIKSIDLEIQERACQFSRIAEMGDSKLLSIVCESMPTLRLESQIKVEKNIESISSYSKINFKSVRNHLVKNKTQVQNKVHSFDCPASMFIKQRGCLFSDSFSLLGVILSNNYDPYGAISSVTVAFSLGNIKSAKQVNITDPLVKLMIPKDSKSDKPALKTENLNGEVKVISPDCQENISVVKLFMLALFTTKPEAQILYSYENINYEINVKLPISLLSYSIPFVLDMEKYRAAWGRSQSELRRTWSPENPAVGFDIDIIRSTLSACKFDIQLYTPNFPNILFGTSVVNHADSNPVWFLLKATVQVAEKMVEIILRSSSAEYCEEFMKNIVIILNSEII